MTATSLSGADGPTPPVEVSRTPAPTAGIVGPAEALALRAQYTLVAVGGFETENCSSFQVQGPDVWIGGIGGPESPVHYRSAAVGDAVLCLAGFSPDEPIQLTVAVAGRQYALDVIPKGGRPPYREESPTYYFDLPFEPLSRETLFNGSPVDVFTFDEGSFSDEVDWSFYGEEPGYLRSRHWYFAPAPSVRDSLAEAREVTIEARQGDTTAVRTQQYETPTYRTIVRPDGPDGEDGLLVIGFEPGVVVPIGLYRSTETNGNTYALVQEIGTVTMPPSRVAGFVPPAGLMDGMLPGDYCILPPLDGAANMSSCVNPLLN